MAGWDLCVNTQTPLVQFLAPARISPGRGGGREGVPLRRFTEGKDYRFSPGGVTRMVLPLLRRMIADHTVKEAHWISLNPNAPRSVRIPGITLHNIALERGRLAAYGQVKEAIWGTVHGIPSRRAPEELFWTEEFPEYAYYNRLTTERIRELERRHDFDLFYIHDFQQLPIGHMLDTLKPKMYRWHIPFDPSTIPDEWRGMLATYLNSYDVVVVSTRRYLAALRAFGHTGRSQQLYPYVDPSDFSRPPAREVNAVCRRFGIAEGDVVGLVVGRMDPMKGQDRAIRALAELAGRHPRLRLVLVGNGSFSGSGAGLALSKSGRWRRRLEELARKLGVRPRVIFTGHATQRELDCFYERCAFTLLPSVNEGFGLVVIESWLHRKPTVVTDRAGVVELIRDGRNGLLFDPEEPKMLGEKISRLLGDGGELGRTLGRAGFATARHCTIDTAIAAESRLVSEVVGS